MKKHILFIAAIMVATTMFAKDEVTLKDGNLDFLFEAGKIAFVNVDLSKAEVVEFDKDDNVKELFGSYEQYVRSHITEATEKEIKDEIRLELPQMIESRDELQRQLVLLQDKSYTEDEILQFRTERLSRYQGLPSFNVMNKNGMRFISYTADEASKFTPQYAKIYSKAKHIVIANPSDADYKFVFVADTIDLGSSAGAITANVASHFGGLGAAVATNVAENSGGVIFVGDLIVYDNKTMDEVCRLHLNHYRGNAGMLEWTRMHVMMDELFTKEILPLAKKEAKKKK